MELTLVTDKRRIKCPVDWDGVSTDKYQTLVSIPDQNIIDIISVFNDMDREYVEELKDQDIVGILSTAVQFAYKPISEKVLEFFEYNEQAYPIKTNPGAMSFGQMVQLRKAIEGKTLNACISLACAVYMQPRIDQGPFDLNRAQELEMEFRMMPITKTYGLGFFYLRKSMSGGNLFMNAWALLKKIGIVQMIRFVNLRGLTALSHLQI